MKITLSADAVQGWFVKHVEKIAFGLCVLLFALFMLLGVRTSGYKETPKQVRDRASTTKQRVEQTDPWDSIKDSPERVTLTRYSEVVKEGNVPTEGGLYAYTQPLNPFVPRPLVKRQDPKLFPPVKLIVRGMNAAIAIRNAKELPDRLGELKTVKVEPPKPKPSREERRSGRGMSVPPGYGDEFSGMGDSGSDAEGGIPFFGEGPSPPTFGGGSSPLGGAASGGPKIFLRPDGWRPSGLVGSMTGSGLMSGMPGLAGPPSGAGIPGVSGSTSGLRSSTSTILTKPSRIIVVLALIEYEKQLDEFKTKFENAVGYDPRRDRPNYVAIAVERAEVPSDPNAPFVWQQVGSTATAFREVQEWAGVYDEVAHPLYTLPRTSLPIPPILLRDVEEFVSHPEIPRKTEQLVQQTPTGPNMPQQPTGAEGDSDVPSDVPRGQFPRMPGVPGYSMPPGYPGGGTSGGFPASGLPPGTPGLAGGPGVVGGPGVPSVPPGYSPYGGGAEGMESDAAGGLAPGMAGGIPGMAGPGMSGMYPGMVATETTTKYKLVRFFDFTAEPGKVYRYRVQLLIEDPNHPENPALDVSPRMLTDEVAKRVAEVQAKEPQQGRRQHFYLRTEWSEPSEPVSLEPASRFYLGPVARSNVIPHKNGALLWREPLTVDTAVIRWDADWAVDVPVMQSMIPGRVANELQRPVEVVHPISLEFKQLEKYDFLSDCMLVDVRGGEKVGSEGLNTLWSPTEAVFLDSQGNLVVRNEIDDMDGYRRYTFADEGATSTSSSASGAAMPPGMPGGMEPGGLAPGGMFPPSGMPGTERGRRGSGRGTGGRTPRNQGS